MVVRSDGQSVAQTALRGCDADHQVAVTAITARDLPVIQGYVLFCTLTYVLASLLADVMSELLDPRLRESEAG